MAALLQPSVSCCCRAAACCRPHPAASHSPATSTQPNPPLHLQVKQMSSQMRDMRSRMEEDENLKVLMSSLRGANLSDADFADSGVQLRLVELDASDGEQLPLAYDPDAIEEYWGRRPVAVTTRILQVR